MRDVKPFLKHILEECAIILEATEGKEFEGFVSDEILKRAILRSLEVIGEAVRNVPDDFRRRYRHIPWKQLAGLRDVLIHRYFGVDYRNVWKIVKEDIPKLKEE